MKPLDVAGAFWGAFALYWLASSFGRNPARRRENPAARLAHLLYMGLAFILLYSRDTRFGVLDRRFVPVTGWIPWIGAALTGAGVAFAIWARRHIGKQWSAEVAIRENHELIRTGPYARIRHPIYTGILLALFGTALILGELRGLAAVALTVLGFWWKARREEALLAREFGERFEEHKRHTGFFLPRIV